MRTIFTLSIVILLISACSQKDSSDWRSLVDKYFELDKKGLYDSARIVAEQALEVAKESFPANDVKIAISLNNVAEMYRELGHFEKSISYYESAIKIINTQTVNYATYNSNLGLAYFGMGNGDLAEEKFKRSISTISNLNHESNEGLITPFNTLGLIEMDRGNYEAARQYLNKAMLYTEQNPSISNYATLYQNLGQLFIIERNDSAYYYLTKSKELQENYYGKGHASIGDLYGLLGAHFHLKNIYDSALLYYTQDIESKVGLVGQTNPRLIHTFRNISRLYTDLGDSINSKKFKMKVHELEKGK